MGRMGRVAILAAVEGVSPSTPCVASMFFNQVDETTRPSPRHTLRRDAGRGGPEAHPTRGRPFGAKHLRGIAARSPVAHVTDMFRLF